MNDRPTWGVHRPLFIGLVLAAIALYGCVWMVATR